MRVKKDKAYIVVSTDKGYIQGAFPYSKDGKARAEEYLRELTKKNKQEYAVKLV